MKKKNLLLCALTGLFFATVGVACNDAEKKESITISGLDSVQSQIQVRSGAIVELDIPVVTDSNGNIVDVWVEVIDSEGGVVGVSENMFTAKDVGGYTINYVVRTSDGVTHKSSTAVSVEYIQAAFDFTVADFVVEETKIVAVGEEVSLLADGPADTAYEYEVTCGERAETVSEGSFVPTTVGTYTIKVKATLNGKTEQKSYLAYARNQAKIGEVEVFDETWEEVAKINGDKRLSSWSVVESGENGAPLDRNGENGSFLTMTTTQNDRYIEIPLAPRYEKSYYEELAEKGYTDVLVWIYLDAEHSHGGGMRTDPGGRYYQYSIPTLQPKKWTAVRFNLLDRTNVDEDYYRSFLTCYDFYSQPNMHFMNIDNSNDYDSPHETGMKVYISDFYVVKEWASTTGGSTFVEKSGGVIDSYKNDFDTTPYEAYADEFDFAWMLDGEPIGDALDPKDLSTVCHALTYTATGKASGYQSILYQANVDVYEEEETKNNSVVRPFVATQEDLIGSKKYAAGWDTTATTEYLENYDGKTQVTKVAKSQEMTVLANAIHTQPYYEKLLEHAGGKTYYITFDYKIEKAADTCLRYDYKGSSFSVTTGEWHTEKIDLNEFISYIEKMRAQYQVANKPAANLKDGWLISIQNINEPACIYVTMPTLSAITPIESVTGESVLAKKTDTSLNVAELFDTTPYESEYDFIWNVGKETVDIVNPSTLGIGLHTLVLKAVNKATGVTVDAYTGMLDVYDENETPAFVKDETSLAGSKVYGWETYNGKPTAVYVGDYDGKQNVTKVEGYAEAFAVLANPLHTKAYYAQLIDGASNTYYVTFDYKVETPLASISEYDYTGVEAKGQSTNVWKTKTVELRALLDSIEQMRTNFSMANRYPATNWKGALIAIYNGVDNTSTICITTPKLVAASSLETVKGETVLAKKTDTSVDLASLFDTTEYGSEYTFAWKLNGEQVVSVNPSLLNEGMYTLQLAATSNVSGLVFTAYETILDVYDEANARFVTGTSDVVGSDMANWDDGRATTEILTEYEGYPSVVKVHGSKAAVGVLANPLHSQAYYEWLAANADGKTYYVTFSYKIASSVAQRYTYTGAQVAYTANEWQTEKIALSEIAKYVDQMREDFKNANQFRGLGINLDKHSYLVGVYNNYAGADLWVTVPTIVAE